MVRGTRVRRARRHEASRPQPLGYDGRIRSDPHRQQIALGRLQSFDPATAEDALVVPAPTRGVEEGVSDTKDIREVTGVEAVGLKYCQAKG